MKKRLSLCDGFTLVELIVVIAILGILAGVGTIGYSGYVKKANMAADQQLVNDVKNALLLEYYSAAKDGVAAVVITDTETKASSGAAESAMERTFGAGWRGMKLSYDKWGKSAQVEQKTLQHFKNATDPYLQKIYNGEAVPSFANDVDELFLLIEEVSLDVGGQLDSGGAELVQGAAGKTMDADITRFASAWATDKWDSRIIMGDDAGQYGEGVAAPGVDAEVLGAAVANAAVIKARNTSIATYLRDEFGQEVYDTFANSTYGSTPVPKDLYGLYRNGDTNAKYEIYSALVGVPVNEDNFRDIDREYADKIVAFNSAMTVYARTPVKEGFSQAAIDAAAYYAMMDTVSSVNRGNSDDETYWDEMAGAVSLYGDIAQDRVELDELKTMYDNMGDFSGYDNAVIITLVAKDGVPETQASPKAANAAEEG